MSLHRSVAWTPVQRHNAFDPTVRLDLMQNPYGPCPAAIEAVETLPEVLTDSLAATFRHRLGEVYRVSAESVHLLGSVDAAIATIAGRHTGPIVAFPPSGTSTLIAECAPGSDPATIARGPGRDAVIGPEFTTDLPENAMAVIDSPSNPLGSLLSSADLVRLSRACQCVVVDERFAEYSAFSLLPLVRELDNVVVMRSFESWSGLPEISCAWAVAPPRLAEIIEPATTTVRPEMIAGAIATLENQASVSATLKLVREERSRLYRLLRRLLF